MRLLEFLSLALKRLVSRRLLSLLLVLNTALSIGITVGIPIFSGAVSRRILQQEINVRTQTRGWPMFAVRINAQPTDRQLIGVDTAAETGKYLEHTLKAALRLPISTVSLEMQSQMYRLAPRAGDETYTTEYLAGVQAAYVENVAEHITVYEGRPFGEIGDAGELHVWVERTFAESLVFQVGEAYDLGDLFSSGGDVIPIRIAGFWHATEPTEHFWPERPQGHFDGRFLVTGEQFQSFLLREGEAPAGRVSWYYVFEDRRVQLDRADQYIGGLQHVTREVERRLPDGRMDLDPSEDLGRGQRRKASLSVVLFGFSLPLLVILAYSLSSLSETESRMQEQEISMLVSRGSRGRQLLLISAIESVLIILAAIPVGVALALAMAHLLGYASGFLSFALGDPLQVSLLSASWTPMIAILIISLLVRLAATSRVSRRTITSYEQVHSRPPLLWNSARMFFLILLVLVTVYAYRQLENRGAVLASLDALDPRNDPLVLLAPTLFIFTAPLVAAELFVWLVHPIDFIGRLLPWVSAYLASMNLVRDSAKYRATVYRLTLSLTLGVFYASVARSADIWLLDSMQHRYGADLIIKLTPEQGNRFGTFGSSSRPLQEVPTLSSDVYRSVEGVRAATRVAEFEATIQPATDVPYYRLLAVERLSFPQVAYFRSDYARESLGELMNRLAQEPKGILLPTSFPATVRPEVGDILNLSVNLQSDMRLRFDAKVVGFFSHFPTMYPTEQPLVIVNLEYLELNAGILPHDIWLNLEPAADVDQVLRGVSGLNVPLRQVKDLNLAWTTESQRFERTGIFGLLSFCFIAGAALSVADVLVYTTSMVRERALRHAVLQALGVERQTVLITLVCEQTVSLIYGLAVGIGGGVLCAQLYGPYFPLGNGGNPPVPPFVPYVDWSRAWWIALLTAGALLLAQVIVLARLTRANLFEVLRMGARP